MLQNQNEENAPVCGLKLSMDFSLNRALNFVTKSPAAEKARSASTLVGGIVLNA